MAKSFILLLFFVSSLIASVVFFQSCKEPRTKPSATNQPELITTLKIEFKNVETGEISEFFYRDLDSFGSNLPNRWDSIRLKTNSTYYFSVKFLNESDPNEIINVTPEIKSEDYNHLVCYETSANSIIIRSDNDGVYPLGLESKWITGQYSKDIFTVRLMHQPGIKNGNCEIGETDVQVTFPLIIQ